jgi:hypothetical protein
MTTTTTTQHIEAKHFVPFTGPNYAGVTEYLVHADANCTLITKGNWPEISKGSNIKPVDGDVTCQRCSGGKQMNLRKGEQHGYVRMLVLVSIDRIVVDGSAGEAVPARTRRNFTLDQRDEARAFANDLYRAAKAAGFRDDKSKRVDI